MINRSIDMIFETSGQPAPTEEEVQFEAHEIVQRSGWGLPLIERLKKAGFIVEMDDFGSGYSSLNMLKDIPVDILKIDMMFLYRAKDTERSKKIVTQIIALAKALEIGVVTEGVENKEQFEFLRNSGSDIFQGYYFSKPIRLKDFEEQYMQSEEQ